MVDPEPPSTDGRFPATQRGANQASQPGDWPG